MVTKIHIDLSSVSEADRASIEEQLTTIFASSHFKSANQMQRFLKYVVDTTLQGKEKSLKQYTIAVEALGYPEDFDSDSNPLVRILGGRVRDRLSKYYLQEGEADLVHISIPKGSYIPVIEKKVVSQSLKKNLSGASEGPKLGLFCFNDDALSKESNILLSHISSTLAKELSHFIFSRLYVQIPYLGKTRSNVIGKDAREKYGVDFTLLLFIQTLPKNKYQLLYRLWNNNSEEVISSDFFDVYPGQDIKEQNIILNKISAVVADIYQGKLHTCWSRGLLRDKSSIPEKFQVLAYYRYYADNFGKENFQKSVSFCEAALKRDVDDIVANVLFADYCRRDYVYNYNVIEDSLEKGRECAERAIRLRPDSHEAHFAMAQILFCLNDWDQSIGQFNLARDISKNHAVVEYGTGFHFCLMGCWEEGFSLAMKAMELSGTYPDWFNITPFLYHYMNGNYREALKDALKITTPNIIHGPLARCACYGQLGKAEKATQEFKDLLVRCPSFQKDGEQILKKFLGSSMVVNKLWEGIVKGTSD